MTVAIDPSEVRRQATVKALVGSQGHLRLPARTLILGGLGGASLLAFTIGAFSFFGGLADPRVRPVRPMPVASKMPDLKDGLPALVADGAPAGPAATVLNLPKPPAAEPASAPAPVPAKIEAAKIEAAKVETGLRGNTLAAVESAPPVAEATGSVAQRKAVVAPPRAKAAPVIENAATVPGDAKAVPLIAPARTAGALAPARSETVRAKPVAALSAEPERPSPAAARQAAQDTSETKSAPARKSAQKLARAKAKPAAEASAEPREAPAAAEPEDEGFGSKLNRGIKAIGGVFGQD